MPTGIHHFLEGKLMINQFSRTSMLYGEAAMKALSNARVAVFGIGGVGGYTVEALSRSGVGYIDLIDNDTVSVTNINRQIYATLKTIGRYKVDVAKERIAEINPQAVVKTYKTFFTPESSDQFNFSNYDYVVDAIDTVAGKLELAVQCQKTGTPIIASMGAGNKLDPTAFEVSDIYSTSVCPLARVMRSELKKRGVKRLKVVYSKEKPITPVYSDEKSHEEFAGSTKRIPGSNAFVPPVVGLIIAAEVINDLTMCLQK